MSDKQLETKKIVFDTMIAGWLLFASFIYFRQYGPNILVALKKIIGMLK